MAEHVMAEYVLAEHGVGEHVVAEHVVGEQVEDGGAGGGPRTLMKQVVVEMKHGLVRVDVLPEGQPARVRSAPTPALVPGMRFAAA